MMRVAVTGAAGFIGAHTSRALMIAGHEVVAIDSFSPFHPRDLKDRRWAQLIGGDAPSVVEVDVADEESLRRVFDAEQPDAVVHLAAQAGVRYSARHPGDCVSANVLGTHNVLRVADEFGVSRVLYASSSSVYGATPGVCREDDLTITPTSLYGTTKLAGEMIARSQHASTGLRSIGMRLFTVYGPWGRPDMAYFRLLVCALTGSEFPLYASVDVVRDFTYVDDAVVDIVALLDLAPSVADPCLVVNVGGGSPCSLRSLIEEVESVTARRVFTREAARTLGDVARTEASTELLERLGLPVPRTTLSNGVARVAAWIESLATDAARWVELSSD